LTSEGLIRQQFDCSPREFALPLEIDIIAGRPVLAIPPRTSEKDSAATRSFGRSTVFPFEVIIVYIPSQ
jgi:hypothetical protein